MVLSQNSSFINSVDEVCLSPYKDSVARMTFVAKNNNTPKPRETADGTLRLCFLPVRFSVSVKYYNMSKGPERIDYTEHYQLLVIPPARTLIIRGLTNQSLFTFKTPCFSSNNL